MKSFLYPLIRQVIEIAAWLSILFLLACTSEEELLTANAGAGLRFSEDAVVFDTVFTSVGSATKRLKVYNPNKRTLVIDKISLGGRGTSPYHILVNGLPAESVQNLRLLGGDSLTVLVNVQINPYDSTLPFVVYDSLLFQTNHTITTQNVKLLAWGQDANFVRYATLSTDCNRIWTAGKPYVLYDSLVVPPNCILTLEAGTRVYAYNNAVLLVEGTLDVQGTPEQPVTFTGFRQESDYRDLPAQWQGIIFRPTSRKNRVQGTTIKNAVNGIMVSAIDVADAPDVELVNTTIKNMSGLGIAALATNITLTNTLITNCGGGLFSGRSGGNYVFTHCTLANFNQDYFQGAPALLISNVYNANGREARHPLYWQMRNSVIWGNLPDEILVFSDPTTGFTADITYCVLKTNQATTFEATGNQLYARQEPLFANPETLSLQPDSLSLLINAGTPTDVQTDITGQPRNSLPDIGAYEYIR